MLIGVPKEIKVKEFRVGLTPSAVREYVAHGHKVIVETNAASAIGKTDQEYIKAGAKILGSAKEIFEKAEMIVKVKEPQAEECEMLHEGQIIFTYLHLAADKKQAEALIKNGSVAIAYETVTSPKGGLPLLAPMSEVAGRMSINVGAYHLQASNGGKGILIGGVPGVKGAEVVILGGGVAGTNAAKMAVGLQARVTIIEKSLDRIRYLEDIFGVSANIIYSTNDAVDKYLSNADLVVGSVLIPGAKAPKLITKELLGHMKEKSVIVDIAIDQGGCADTSKATTHDNPTFVVDDVIHYCVANMPGAVPRTSAHALNNAVLPYGLQIADKGWKQALLDNEHLRYGLNICHGKVTQHEVANDLGFDYIDPKTLLTA